MKKIVLYTALVLALLFPVAALAADFVNPAELLSSLTGVSVQELYEKRQQNNETFGQIADEYGVLEQYKAGQIEIKKQIIDERVKSGVITQEQGEQIKKALEDRMAACDGSLGANRGNIGQQFGGGMKFGGGSGRGMGNGAGMGRMGGRGAGIANGASI